MSQYVSKSGKRREKVRANTVRIGDIIESHNIYLPDLRVIGLGKVWTESFSLDAEDARSFGGQGEVMRGKEEWQYAYVEPVAKGVR